MTSPTARHDLKLKLSLEPRLLREIRTLNRRIILDFTKQLAISNNIIDAGTYNSDLERILGDHYVRVGDVFSDRIRKDMPADIDVPENVNAEIAAALAIFFAARAPAQAARINGTTSDNMIDAVDSIFADQQAAQIEGRTISAGESVALATAALSRKLRGREGAIAMLETQAPAEATKLTEAQILMGQSPYVVTGTPQKTPVDKTWETVGDSLVRPAHRSADLQKVDVNDPFIVDGQQLMYPGDDSLGASLGNIINCRCASVENRQSIFDVMRSRQ